MIKDTPSQPTSQQEEFQQPAKRKKFQGFSMSFLFILLAIAVGLYITCTIILND